MSSTQALQAQMWYPAAQLEKKKEERENTTISNLSTHKQPYFQTGNWNISHKPVHLDIFILTEMTLSNEYLWV